MEPDVEALERDLAKRSRALWLAIRDARSAEDIVRELPTISRVRSWATDMLTTQRDAFDPLAASLQPLEQLSAALVRVGLATASDLHETAAVALVDAATWLEVVSPAWAAEQRWLGTYRPLEQSPEPDS